MTKGGLGKGLSALIPTGARSMEELDLTSISANPDQPRRTFDDASLGTLAASMRQVGVLQPVVVRRQTKGFELVAGERRLRAAQIAGLSKIPAVIVDTDSKGSLERAIIENLHREDLNAIEEAAAFKQLLEEAGLTHEQLADSVGISRPQITNSLRLLELPSEVQRLVIEGKLAKGHARALCTLAAHPLIGRIAQRVVAEQMSVRQTEDLVKDNSIDLVSLPTPRETASPKQVEAGLLELTDRIAEALGTKAKVKMGARKGKLTIEFADLADLDRIYSIIKPSHTAQL